MKIDTEILEKVRLYENNKRIIYAKTDGKLYKSVKAFYILAFVFSIFMNLFFILGNVFSSIRLEVFKDSIIIVSVFSALMILALVLSCFKESVIANLVSFLLNAASSVVLCLEFAKLLEDVVGYKTVFYWRHLAPLCLLALLSLWITVITVRAILKTRKSYKTVIENTAEE